VSWGITSTSRQQTERITCVRRQTVEIINVIQWMPTRIPTNIWGKGDMQPFISDAIAPTCVFEIEQHDCTCANTVVCHCEWYISPLVVCNWKWIYITHSPQILTWKSIRVSLVMMLDANNIGIAVVIALLYLVYKLRCSFISTSAYRGLSLNSYSPNGSV